MKNIAASLALSTLAAAGAEAQEARPARVAPAAVYEVAPGLGEFTDEVLFGEVWARKELAPRDRSLITLAALVATGKTGQTGTHARRALDNGVKPEEIGELITQLGFYTGWPNAASAVMEVKRVFDERGISPAEPAAAVARVDLEPGAEAARRAAVDTAVAPTAPALADLTNRVLFGKVWRRPDLSARDRSLITMAALIAIGQPEQLPFHISRAMDNGLSRLEVSEVPTHLAFYAGWPRVMSAVPVIAQVFARREAVAPTADPGLEIVRAGQSAVPGAADRFTGEVRISGPYSAEAPARVGGATVAFAPGARTHWHTHPLGQTLFIVSGQGWVQKDGEPAQRLGPGDVAWIPPNVRHWHGAAADHPMTHFAVAEALDGTSVTWMEPVPDAVYAAARG